MVGLSPVNDLELPRFSEKSRAFFINREAKMEFKRVVFIFFVCF